MFTNAQDDGYTTPDEDQSTVNNVFTTPVGQGVQNSNYTTPVAQGGQALNYTTPVGQGIALATTPGAPILVHAIAVPIQNAVPFQIAPVQAPPVTSARRALIPDAA